MKKNSKSITIISILLTFIMLFSLLSPFQILATTQTKSVTVYVDGELVFFDVPPLIIDGRTMVPLRAIFEAMGAEVTWDQERQMVIGIKDDTMVSLYIDSVTPTVNNEIHPLDVAATIVNNRTLAPLRFVGEAFGGTVVWDGATNTVNIFTTPESYDALPKMDVDFQVNASDLQFVEDQHPSWSYVRPGMTIRISTKVIKNGEDTYGGGKIVLTLHGNVIDRIPFYIDKSKDYIYFYKSYQIPLSLFYSLAEGESVAPVFKAQVVCDQLTNDTNLSNNTAQINVNVEGNEALETWEVSNSTIESIKAVGTYGNNLAKPGSNLALKANVSGSGKKTAVYFYVNGELVSEKIVTPPSSGAATTITYNYYVPYENSGLMNYSVKLDNGDEKTLPVSVAPYEFEVLSDGISWINKSDTLNYKAGETLSLTANILRKNKNSFADANHALRVYFLINGVLSEGLKIDSPSGSMPYIGTVNYSYHIPTSQTGPLTVKVLVDPGGLFSEEKEDNNTATVTIPETISGVLNNDVSINSIRFSPAYALPGQQTELIVGIKNNSGQNPDNSLGLVFKIDGQAITTGAGNTGIVRSSNLEPGQTYITYKMWSAPENLNKDVVYSVEINLDGSLEGDDPSDNSASITIPLAQPDLSVEPNSLKSSPSLFAGRDGFLIANVSNCGAIAAEDVDVAYYINDVEIGRQTMNISEFSAIEVQTSFTVPLLDSQLNNESIQGVSGFVSQKLGTSTMTYAVKIDPENKISESNESNNSAGPKTLTSLIPSSKGAIHVQVNDLNENHLSGALVQMTTGTFQATATTDSTGYCTFINVPFGAYDLTVTKSGYTEGRSYDEYLYASNYEDLAEVFLDSRSTLTGIVSAASSGGLNDVKIYVNETSQSTRTNEAGAYTLKLSEGLFTLVFTKAGYEYKTETITVSAGTILTKNLTMETTDQTTITGIIVDENDFPLVGQEVKAKDVSNNSLASTTTDATGHYSMNVPLATSEMWVSIQVSYHGDNRVQGVYMVRGIPVQYDISFVPQLNPINLEATSSTLVSPWVVCASMPGTFFNPDYKVDAVYGLFGLNLSIKVEDQFVTDLNLETESSYWLHSSVSSSWNPAEILAINKTITAYNTVAVLLPTSIPLAVTSHSANMTKVRIKKISILSDDQEIDCIYPNTVGSYNWSPNAQINVESLRIKYYLQIGPDNGVVNPAAGYNKDRVLIIWNPTENVYDKIGNYQVIGWDENTAHEMYMDE